MTFSHDITANSGAPDPLIESTRGMSRKLSEIQVQMDKTPSKIMHCHNNQLTDGTAETKTVIQASEQSNHRISWNKVRVLKQYSL